MIEETFQVIENIFDKTIKQIAMDSRKKYVAFLTDKSIYINHFADIQNKSFFLNRKIDQENVSAVQLIEVSGICKLTVAIPNKLLIYSLTMLQKEIEIEIPGTVSKIEQSQQYNDKIYVLNCDKNLYEISISSKKYKELHKNILSFNVMSDDGLFCILDNDSLYISPQRENTIIENTKYIASAECSNNTVIAIGVNEYETFFSEIDLEFPDLSSNVTIFNGEVQSAYVYTTPTKIFIIGWNDNSIGAGHEKVSIALLNRMNLVDGPTHAEIQIGGCWGIAPGMIAFNQNLYLFGSEPPPPMPELTDTIFFSLSGGIRTTPPPGNEREMLKGNDEISRALRRNRMRLRRIPKSSGGTVLFAEEITAALGANLRLAEVARAAAAVEAEIDRLEAEKEEIERKAKAAKRQTTSTEAEKPTPALETPKPSPSLGASKAATPAFGATKPLGAGGALSGAKSPLLGSAKPLGSFGASKPTAFGGKPQGQPEPAKAEEPKEAEKAPQEEKPKPNLLSKAGGFGNPLIKAKDGEVKVTAKPLIGGTLGAKPSIGSGSGSSLGAKPSIGSGSGSSLGTKPSIGSALKNANALGASKPLGTTAQSASEPKALGGVNKKFTIGDSAKQPTPEKADAGGPKPLAAGMVKGRFGSNTNLAKTAGEKDAKPKTSWGTKGKEIEERASEEKKEETEEKEEKETETEEEKKEEKVEEKKEPIVTSGDYTDAISEISRQLKDWVEAAKSHVTDEKPLFCRKKSVRSVTVDNQQKTEDHKPEYKQAQRGSKSQAFAKGLIAKNSSPWTNSKK